MQCRVSESGLPWGTQWALRTGLLVLLWLASGSARAQEDWRFSGQFFGDYQALIQSPDRDLEGDNAFQIRRVFFTAKFPLSKSIDGLFRVEGTRGKVIEENLSPPYLKDVYLRWKDVLGDGHHMILGLSAPPKWQVSQRFWSYRALARTVQHRAGIGQPRDTGVALYGPLGKSGTTNYGVMIGNDNRGVGETDRRKRFYAYLDTRLGDDLIVGVGTDYHTIDDGNSYNGSLFVGWENGDRSRLASEAFYDFRPMHGSSDADAIMGASLYGWHFVSERGKVILRADLTRFDRQGVERNRTWLFAGFSYSPEKDVEIIPNIQWEKDDRDGRAEVMARLTLYANF